MLLVYLLGAALVGSVARRAVNAGRHNLRRMARPALGGGNAPRYNRGDGDCGCGQ